MIVGHIILAHKGSEQIMRLIRAVNTQNSFVIIHLDKKTNSREFDSLGKLPNVHFVKNRLSVNWGGFSQISAVINSIELLLKICPNTNYINLLSGQDYPVRKISEFHEYLTNNPKLAFMEFFEEDDPWVVSAHDRFNHYHLSDNFFFGKYRVEKIMDLILPKRRFPNGFKLVGKSQWFTIDQESASYIIKIFKSDRRLVECFRYSWGADELFFQSLLYNSPLKDKLVNKNLRYIDWSEGKSSPKLLGISDTPMFQNGDYFFARKFDIDLDKEVLDYIDNKIL